MFKNITFLDKVSLKEMGTVQYKPVDVNREIMEESSLVLVKKYPGLKVHCFVANFINQLHLIRGSRKKLFCFFGSTIGNLSNIERESFFRYLGEIMSGEDMLLLGIDMIKSKGILEKAYNDNSNVTACFNKNILNVVNSITGTNFNPQSFGHNAFFNQQESRIEMHLRALTDFEILCPLRKIKNQDQLWRIYSYRKFS